MDIVRNELLLLKHKVRALEEILHAFIDKNDYKILLKKWKAGRCGLNKT